MCVHSGVTLFTVFTILKIGRLSSDSSCQPEVALNDGEGMTCELRGIVNEFSEKAGTTARLCSTVFKTNQSNMLSLLYTGGGVQAKCKSNVHQHD